MIVYKFIEIINLYFNIIKVDIDIFNILWILILNI